MKRFLILIFVALVAQSWAGARVDTLHVFVFLQKQTDFVYEDSTGAVVDTLYSYRVRKLVHGFEGLNQTLNQLTFRYRDDRKELGRWEVFYSEILIDTFTGNKQANRHLNITKSLKKKVDMAKPVALKRSDFGP